MSIRSSYYEQREEVYIKGEKVEEAVKVLNTWEDKMCSTRGGSREKNKWKQKLL